MNTTESKIRSIVREAIDPCGPNKIQINEASFAKVVTDYFDYGFIIISASRTCKAEMGKTCTEEEELEQRRKNNQNEKQMRKDLASSGFGYIPTYGGYKEKVIDKETGKVSYVDNPNAEPSFIVPAIKVGTTNKKLDHERLKELGISLSKKYNQDEFLYKPPNSVDKNAYFVTKDGSESMKFDDVKINDMSQIYFTYLRKRGGNRRFSLTTESVLYIDASPLSLSEARKRYGEIFLRIK